MQVYAQNRSFWIILWVINSPEIVVWRRHSLSIILSQMETPSQADQQIVRVDYQEGQLLIVAVDPKGTNRYHGAFTFDNLPSAFKVLFDSLPELYEFMNQEAKFELEDSTLNVSVPVAGRFKNFQLDLELQELTREEQLERRVGVLEQQLKEKILEADELRTKVSITDATLEQKKKSHDELQTLFSEKESQNLKLYGRIRVLECQMDDLREAVKNGQSFQDLKPNDEYTPRKKATGARAKKAKEQADYGKKLTLKIDTEQLNYGKFIVSGNEVEKTNGPTYQLLCKEPMPKEGRYYFDVKILSLRNSNFVVGLVTEKNRQHQFSWKHANCVCYNGYDGSFCEESKQTYGFPKPKEGQRIRTIVDMDASSIEWLVISPDGKKKVGPAAISTAMFRQTLIPYIELYWEGNKIRLNA